MASESEIPTFTGDEMAWDPVGFATSSDKEVVQSQNWDKVVNSETESPIHSTQGPKEVEDIQKQLDTTGSLGKPLETTSTATKTTDMACLEWKRIAKRSTRLNNKREGVIKRAPVYLVIDVTSINV